MGDSVESAEKEIGLWFSQAEITSWRSAQTEWVYEEEELEPLQALPSKVDGLVSASGSSEVMALVLSLEARVGQLEGGKPAPAKAAPAKAAPAEEEEDDVDLFGSSDEEESEEKKRITEER